MPTLTFQHGTTINWEPPDDGGGSTQYIDFLNVLPKDKVYDKGLEWCAGLSAISFSLLDANLVNHMTLMDIYKPALDRASLNAVNNNLYDRVTIQNLDKVGNLSQSNKFDLVVGNPPHCGVNHFTQDNPLYDQSCRILNDIDWLIHKEFFTNIINYLHVGADIFISETAPHQWIYDYAKDAGLTFKHLYLAKELSQYTHTQAVIFHFKYET